MNGGFFCYSSSSKHPNSPLKQCIIQFSVSPKYREIILFKAMELKKAKHVNQHCLVGQTSEIGKKGQVRCVVCKEKHGVRMACILQE